MRFRTEIEPIKGKFAIAHGDDLLLLGSCFADTMGRELALDGFHVVSNPFGTLYNPVSILRALHLAMGREALTPEDFILHEGTWHCMDFAMRYSGPDADGVLDSVRADLASLRDAIERSHTVIITFGSAWVYDLRGTGRTVGNCHKLPADSFDRRRLGVAEAAKAMEGILDALGSYRNVIFTISPIRHLADGLHGNQLSKATLQLAVDEVLARAGRDNCQYFPSYEILLDDLRDYRFYADDLKHPSTMAERYIYEHFAGAYFSSDTRAEAGRCRAEALLAAHRQILNQS